MERREANSISIQEKEGFFKETLSFYKELSIEQQKEVLIISHESKYKKGETLHAGSDDCSGLFLIKKGQVRVFIISESGKEITLYRLFERDVCIFSASCMMRNINFKIFVETEKDAEVYLIPTMAFKKLSEEVLPVSNFSNQLLASRFSDVMWVLEQVLFMSFDKRLALFLLEQATIEESDTFQMTQETIARHLGSAREVVSRMLKYFAEEGLVEVTRGKVNILNREKLEQLAYETAKV